MASNVGVMSKTEELFRNHIDKYRDEKTPHSVNSYREIIKRLDVLTDGLTKRPGLVKNYDVKELKELCADEPRKAYECTEDYMPSCMLGSGFWSVVYLANELSQMKVLEGVWKYNFMIGHVSDVALPGLVTSLLLWATQNKNKTVQRLAAVAAPIVFTLSELCPLDRILSDKTIRFDWYDIPCYFIGSALAYAAARAASSEEKRKKIYSFLGKINPVKYFFRKI